MTLTKNTTCATKLSETYLPFSMTALSNPGRTKVSNRLNKTIALMESHQIQSKSKQIRSQDFPRKTKRFNLPLSCMRASWYPFLPQLTPYELLTSRKGSASNERQAGINHYSILIRLRTFKSAHNSQFKRLKFICYPLRSIAYVCVNCIALACELVKQFLLPAIKFRVLWETNHAPPSTGPR